MEAIRGITEVVIYRETGAAEDQLDFVDETTSELMARIAAMPPHLGFGMVALVRLFETSAVASGAVASNLTLVNRAILLERWRRAPLGPARDFVTFFDKMGAFVYYSQREGRDV
jgi:hypothetical protein